MDWGSYNEELDHRGKAVFNPDFLKNVRVSVKKLNGRLKFFSLGVSSSIIYSAGEGTYFFLH